MMAKNSGAAGGRGPTGPGGEDLPVSPLRRHRDSRGWSQTDLIRRIKTELGLDPDAKGPPSAETIRRWETGTIKPSAYYLAALVAVLGVSATELGFCEPVRVFGRIPALADQFQPRNVAREIDTELQAGCTVVVRGMPGTGKTQLAAHYARTLPFTEPVQIVLWITATDGSSITAGYQAAARTLLNRVFDDQHEAALAVLAWLESTDRHVLVVLDDLHDPADLTGLWPAGVTVRTLITTWRDDPTLRAHGRTIVESGLFTPEEARDYLIAKLDPAHLKEPDDLAADLGHLPLALAQAAALITDQDQTCTWYRRLFATARSTAEVFPTWALADGYAITITTTWTTALTIADTWHPKGVARRLLEIAALLDPNGIPADLFTTTAIKTYARSDPTQPLTDTDIHTALHNLRRTSLITITSPERPTSETTPTDDPTTDNGVDSDTPTIQMGPTGARLIRIHGLVQHATRDHTHNPAATAQAAADALDQLWPERALRDSQLGTMALANARWFLTKNNSSLTERNGSRPLARRYLTDTISRGDLLEAGQFAQVLLSAQSSDLGTDHRDCLTTRTDIAHIRAHRGDVLGALTLFEQLLRDQSRTLGPYDPSTLRTRRHIYSWSGHSGQVAAAIAGLEQLLIERTIHIGPEHPDTLNTRNDISFWRAQTGDLTAALSGSESLVDDRARILGPEHPDTLVTRSNLASWYARDGDIAKALVLFGEVLDDRVRVLGPDDPKTLVTRNNIAYWRGRTGDFAGALAESEQVLRDRTRVLGPDHPGTLGTRGNYATWLGCQGAFDDAINEFDGLTHDQTRIRGADHPNTLLTRGNHAYWLGRRGDIAGALTAFEDLLQDQLRVLGPGHPHVARTRENLSYLRDGKCKPIYKPQ